MPTLREAQIPENIHSKSAELLERAGYTRKVINNAISMDWCIITIVFRRNIQLLAPRSDGP